MYNLAEQGSSRHKSPAIVTPQEGRCCSGALNASVQNSMMAHLVKAGTNVKILIVSGERRAESAGRAKYNELELNRTHATAKAHRLVHHWRNVIDYSEQDIWAVLKRHLIRPHPAYSCGWNRCSCMLCVFSLPRHWAGIRELFPQDYAAIRQDEIILGFTVDNEKTLDEYIGNAVSCVNYSDEKAVKQLVSGDFTVDDLLCRPDEWHIPAGAFQGGRGGPC